MTALRTVTRVTTKRRLGRDAQVDDKALVIAPDDPALTDPFLALRRTGSPPRASTGTRTAGSRP